MPNLNNLYRTVFETGVQSYDPEQKFYTVVMKDKAPFDRFYDSLEQNLKLRISEDALSIVNVNEGDAKSLLRDTYDMLDDKYYHPPFNYIYICYLDNAGESLRKLSEYVGWARELKRMSDNIMILFVMNSDVKIKETLLSIGDEFFRDTEVFFFTLSTDASEVKKQAVVSSVGATIILNSFREQFRSHANRKSNALIDAEQYVNDLSEEAIKEFSLTEHKTWSSVHCKFFDRKMDFLAWYCYHMTEHVRPLNDDLIFAAFDRLYKDHVDSGSKEGDNRRRILLQALTMLPMVEPPAKKKKGSEYTLASRFDDLYGSDGSKIIELSMRTSLAASQKQINLPALSMCAEKVLRECMQYYTADLYGNIRRALTAYIAEKTRVLEERGKALQRDLKETIHDGDTPLDAAASAYVTKYIERHDFHNEIQFWMEFENYLALCKGELDAVLNENKADLEKLSSFKLLCKETMANFEQDEEMTFDELTLSEMIHTIDHLEPNAPLSQKIRNTYQQCRGSSDVRIHNRLDDIFKLNLIPNIYRDEMIDFEEGICVIRGYERNGKYMIFET